MKKEVREQIKNILNKAVKITDCEEGHTVEVEVKDKAALVEVITAIQGVYELGIDSDKKQDFTYDLNENIDEDKEEA